MKNILKISNWRRGVRCALILKVSADSKESAVVLFLFFQVCDSHSFRFLKFRILFNFPNRVSD